MSPIKINPETYIYSSTSKETIIKNDCHADGILVQGLLYILPRDASIDYLVEVDGFRNEPGGIVSTQRLTAGQTWDMITLTTKDDAQLKKELGVQKICIDGVLYEAVNP